MQKLFLSGSAGAFLALAIAGRRPKQDSQTWVETRESAAQTYDEPRAAEVALPPIVTYLPPPPPQPPRPPAPQLVYDLKPKAPMRSSTTQTTMVAVESAVQTDWHGAPAMLSRGNQTAPPLPSYEAGVQTLGIPHTDAFCQAGSSVRSTGTQPATTDMLDVSSTPGGRLGGAYHPLLAERRPQTAGQSSSSSSCCSSSKQSTAPSGSDAPSNVAGDGSWAQAAPLPVNKMIQTMPQVATTTGMQCDANITRTASAQTTPLHPPMSQACQVTGLAQPVSIGTQTAPTRRGTRGGASQL